MAKESCDDGRGLITAVGKYVKLKCSRTDSTGISVTETKKAKPASLKQQLTFDTAVFKIPRLSWLLVVFFLRENILALILLLKAVIRVHVFHALSG